MPIYMDRHDIPGVTAEAVAEAHNEDLKIQDRFNCKGLTYWFDEEKGMAFCLIEAPDKKSVQELHDYAHGLIPNRIIEVESSLVEAFLGRIEDPDQPIDAKLPIINDPAFRVVMVAFPELSLNGIQKGVETQQPIDSSSVRKLFKNAVESHSGQQVEHNEYFFMASFKKAQNSVESALEIQKNFRSIVDTEFPQPIGWRIGLSAGVPVSDDEALFGQTVKNATRLGFIASPGTILISSLVADNFNNDVVTPFHLNTDRGISAITPQNEAILNRIMESIEQQGAEPNFNVDQLAKTTALSKSQLYRKLKSLSDYTPIDFIKEFRLRKAAVEMQRQSGTVSEIAYASGFSSLSYFSKCFLKRFKVLPSVFAQHFSQP